jgi:hypothetical protein
MGCNCCDEPPCPGPSIQSKGSSATGSKEPPPTPCGYSHAGKYWAIRTDSENGSWEEGDYHGTRTANYVYTVAMVDGVCTETGPVCSGSASVTEGPPDGWRGSCTSTLNEDCSWSGTYIETSPTGVVTEYPYTIPCHDRYYPRLSTYSSEVTPEEGESTEELISRVTSDLPPYPSDWGWGSGSASRDLSPDESSFSLSKIKWRLQHQPTGTCYLKVWMRRVTTPEDGEPEYSDIAPYTWTGSGNPCFDDPERAPWAEENFIYGPEAEIGTPSEDGTITVEIVKWSCVEGYTPPDDGTANGYPPVEVEE